ncbi:MAG: ligase-associated DNA damage response endonuclease PdeM [Hyphomicrobiales bacterium]
MSIAEVTSQAKDDNQIPLSLMGEALLACPGGVLFWPSQDALVVADLHLEKGSSFARRGVFLPPYDSRATLERLARIVERLTPKTIIALGDSFHDGQGAERLCAEDRKILTSMQAGRDWIWVAGNHDPLPPQELGGTAVDEVSFGKLKFRHEPLPGATGEVAGHLHPCAKVRGRSRSVRRPCFIENGERLIMPAFGALTGSLNICDGAYSSLFKTRPLANIYMLGEEQIYKVNYKECRPDSRLR